MTDPLPDMTEVHEALQESPEDRQTRISHLYTQFDPLRKGYLGRDQIEEGFRKMHIPPEYRFARELLEACDKNHDGKCDIREFERYMDQKEIELYGLFRQIDLKCNGTIFPEDLQSALNTAGITLREGELHEFVARMDADSNGIVTFREWRDFLLLVPDRPTIASIYQFWEKASPADIGEQSVIPPGLRQKEAWKYFLAGGVAGAVSRTATAPLDRLKVQLQVQTAAQGITGGLAQIYREGGWQGYFRGNGVNILKVAPESAIKFFSYEIMKKVMNGPEDKPVSPLHRLAAGGIAGAIAQTAIYPMDLLKTRLQTARIAPGSRPPSFIRLAAEIMRKEGPLAFYRGLLPSLMGMVPYAGLDLAAYETLKDLAQTTVLEGREPGPLWQLACGTISGAFGATTVYPLNVIRTRLQAQTVGYGPQYTGMTDVFRQTLKTEGVGGFYRGLGTNLLKVAPAASITYILYEEMKNQLRI